VWNRTTLWSTSPPLGGDAVNAGGRRGPRRWGQTRTQRRRRRRRVGGGLQVLAVARTDRVDARLGALGRGLGSGSPPDFASCAELWHSGSGPRNPIAKDRPGPMLGVRVRRGRPGRRRRTSGPCASWVGLGRPTTPSFGANALPLAQVPNAGGRRNPRSVVGHQSQRAHLRRSDAAVSSPLSGRDGISSRSVPSRRRCGREGAATSSFRGTEPPAGGDLGEIEDGVPPRITYATAAVRNRLAGVVFGAPRDRRGRMSLPGHQRTVAIPSHPSG
jgi:hypothetical protein